MEAQSLILALNETRKTLLASRLLLVRGARARDASLAPNIHPGDGVWLDGCERIDTASMRAPLDLLFLDADQRVVAVVANLHAGSAVPEVDGAVGILQLAPGTIRLSQTQKGDHIVVEPIAQRSVQEPTATRASRG